MFQPPNYIWECKNCDESLSAYYDEELLLSITVPPKCLKCGGEMRGRPIVHRGPHPENPFKKH